MVIEFIGCSGSGKSTLSASLVKELEALGINVKYLQVGRNIWLDFVTLPWFIGFLIRRRTFCKFAVSTLMRDADSLFTALNLLRNFSKKMGMHDLLRSKFKDHHVVWDEGTVHAAHNLFVHVHSKPRSKDIVEFAQHVPKPDLIVYIRRPFEVVISQILQRGHRRLKGRETEVRSFVKHSFETFETLIEVETIKQRLLVVENTNDGDAAIQEISTQVAYHISNTLRLVAAAKVPIGGVALPIKPT